MLDTLRSHQLYEKLSNFWLKEIIFLGHITSEKRVAMDPSKIEAITNWPRPMVAIKIKGFLGLADYHKKFM